MDFQHYPKVLIIGPTFTKRSGAGITLNNLFFNWPKEAIAVASSNIDLTQGQVCKNYYQLGNQEEKWTFPFSILQRKIKSGKIDESQFENYEGKSFERIGLNTRKKKGGAKQNLKKNIIQLLHRLGVYYWVYRYQVSDQFLDWVKEFNPDIIYMHGGFFVHQKFALQLLDRIETQLAVHIMDDYLSTMNKAIVFRKYWESIINETIKDFLSKATIRMSICQEMSDAYKIRYGLDFSPFHNPAELNHWLTDSRSNWSKKGTFTVLYAGRIGTGTYFSILDIANTVSALGKEGFDIEFILQTTSSDNPITKQVALLPYCQTSPPVPYKELPKKLASADLLVLPIDYDEESIKYIKLSMPTKCSEYMATGTPILVYAPKEVALAKYAKRKKWAYLVTNNKGDDLKNAITILYNDESLRESLGKFGKKFTQEHHDADVIREKFRKALSLLEV